MTLAPSSPNIRFLSIALLVLILATGAILRIWSLEKFQGIGFDEKLYVGYVEQITKLGVWNYPEIVENYIERQTSEKHAFLPPTRVTFLLAASAWQSVTGMPTLESVRAISTLASLIMLGAGAALAWRVGGCRLALGLSALVAFAPTQIYSAHRALIDGFFATIAFFVFWSLWEILQKPKSRRWLVVYGMSLALMVLTKENAAFVYLALLGILAFTPWHKLGSISKPLIYVTLGGPAIGSGILILLGGGFENVFTAFLLNVRKSYDLPYAIYAGDGPWFRYVIDMISVAPAMTILAIGGFFRTHRNERFALYCLIFVGISYLVMGNLRYGLNLRYSLIWDFPLRYFAMLPLIAISSWAKTPRTQALLLTLAVIAVALLDLLNYRDIFIEHAVYDPVPKTLMQALRMVK